MSLPKWLTVAPDKKVNSFVCDPDIFYPALLTELGVETPDQYWLEVAFGCMKWDFDMLARLAGKVTPNRSITRRVRADDGRKARWNLTMHPVGGIPKIEGIPEAPGVKRFEDLPMSIRSAHIRHHYKRIRGFIPTG